MYEWHSKCQSRKINRYDKAVGSLPRDHSLRSLERLFSREKGRSGGERTQRLPIRFRLLYQLSYASPQKARLISFLLRGNTSPLRCQLFDLWLWHLRPNAMKSLSNPALLLPKVIKSLWKPSGTLFPNAMKSLWKWSDGDRFPKAMKSLWKLSSAAEGIRLPNGRNSRPKFTLRFSSASDTEKAE